MTQQRRDGHSTEFGLWLRNQVEVSSSLGFVATNIDYVWKNYRTGLWMLIEEKRYGHLPKRYQDEMFMLLDAAARSDIKYRGFHVLRFEKKCPDDGRIWWNNRIVDRRQLIKLLRFEAPAALYVSNPKVSILRREIASLDSARG